MKRSKFFAEFCKYMQNCELCLQSCAGFLRDTPSWENLQNLGIVWNWNLFIQKLCNVVQRCATLCEDVQIYAKMCKDVQRCTKWLKDVQKSTKLIGIHPQRLSDLHNGFLSCIIDSSMVFIFYLYFILTITCMFTNVN